MKKYKILIILCCLLFSITESYADNLCVKNRIKANPRNGAVNLAKAFTTVGDNQECPKRFKKIVDVNTLQTSQVLQGPQGPKGDTGANGADGKVNLASCVYEVSAFNCSANDADCTGSISCGNSQTNSGSEINDYMIFYNWNNEENAAYPIAINPILATNQQYPTGVSITTVSEDGYENDYTLIIGITCCLPN